MKTITVEDWFKNRMVENNKSYGLAFITIVDECKPYTMNGKVMSTIRYNGAYKVQHDELGYFVDFTRTRHKEFGILRLEKEDFD